MSFVEHFESVLARRTYRKSLDLTRPRTNSVRIMSPSKINISTCEQVFVKKISKSPHKNNLQKFQELKKDIALRANQRSKKIKTQLKNKSIHSSHQMNQDNKTNTSTSLFCVKAVVHQDQHLQQIQWKRSIKQSIKQSKNKIFKDDHSILESPRIPIRRLSQQIESIDKIFTSKETMIKSNRKLSQTFMIQLKKSNPNYIVKKSPKKVFLNKSSFVGSTKCSENEFGFPKLGGWDSNNIDVEEINF